MPEAQTRNQTAASTARKLELAFVVLGVWLVLWASGRELAAAPGERLLAGDVPYGVWEPAGAGEQETGQTLDLYGPVEAAQDEPKAGPVVVFVHGGGWRRGDKSMVGVKPRAFVRQGFLFASVNYRLEEPVTLREQAGDVAAAVKWLHEHALAFGGDIRLRGDSWQEPAHFEPEVRKREKARMASPA